MIEEELNIFRKVLEFQIGRTFPFIKTTVFIVSDFPHHIKKIITFKRLNFFIFLTKYKCFVNFVVVSLKTIEKCL